MMSSEDRVPGAEEGATAISPTIMSVLPHILSLVPLMQALWSLGT